MSNLRYHPPPNPLILCIEIRCGSLPNTEIERRFLLEHITHFLIDDQLGRYGRIKPIYVVNEIPQPEVPKPGR